jgi:hypothetical protein
MQQFTTDLLTLNEAAAFNPMAMGQFKGAAADAQLLALTDDNTLVSFAPTSPEATMSLPVTGINGTLLGIDTRPANGLVYGLTTANELYTLDPMGFASGDFEGAFTLTEEEQSLLEEGELYLNLHTQTFNDGELRGQVTVALEDDIVATGLMMSEAQQVGAMVPDGPATGRFDVVYDDATNGLTITGAFSDFTSPLLPVGETDAEGNPQSAIHLHNAAAGANGPIVRNFTVDPSGRFSGSFTLTDEEEALLLNDGFYVNLHTENFAGGELRGQVDVELENDVVASDIAIEESQQAGEVVPPDGAAMGSFGIIFDDSTNQLNTTGSFRDLTSPLFPVGSADVEGNPQSAVHLHRGAAGENGPIIRNLTTSDNVAEFVSTLSLPFEGGTISGFDFNPVADRLRLVGDNDQNFRINVDTGEVIVDGDLAFATEAVNAGVNPNVTAAAYTNSFADTETTQLYDIDTLLNSLLLQSPPNDGVLQTIGDLGFNIDPLGGFDIVSSASDDNTAFVVSNASLYTLDLDSGLATNLGMIGSDGDANFQGLAAVPMPPKAVDMLDFEMAGGMDLAAGTVLTDQFTDLGITVATDSEFGAMIFDTDHPTGGDHDLRAEGIGNVLILSEDGDSTDPDDDAQGGTLRFDFDELVGIAEVGFLDIEEMGSTVTFFDEMDKQIAAIEVPPMGNRSLQDLDVNLGGISRMDVFLAGSGAITGIDFLSATDIGLAPMA